MGTALLLALHGPLCFFSWRLSCKITVDDKVSGAVGAMVVYFFLAGSAVWVGGLVPLGSLSWLLAWSWAFGLAALFLKPNKNEFPKDSARAQERQKENSLYYAAALAVFLLTLALLWEGLFSPRYQHDSLTYQLHFAAEYYRAGKISIIPTPFGDPSHAYGPQFTSTFFVWLLAPFGSDFLAQSGQWPFLLLALAAAAGIAEDMGAEKSNPTMAPLLAILCPLFLFEGRTALSDLSIAAFFAASIFFFLRAIARGSGKDAFFALLAAGLMGGCKYTALGLLLLLLPLAAMAMVKSLPGRGWMGWAAGALAGAAGGGIWYIRNWALAGNPVFPIGVSFFGADIFPGLYGRDQMKAWVYHQAGLAKWAEAVSNNASPLLVIFWIAALAMMVHDARKKFSLFSAAVLYAASLPLLVDRLIWNVLPFQVDRFWLAAIPPMAAAAARLAGRGALKNFIVTGSIAAWFFIRPGGGAGDLFISLWIMGGAPVVFFIFYYAIAGPIMAHDRSRQKSAAKYFVVSYSLLVVCCLPIALLSYEDAREKTLKSWEYGGAWSYISSMGGGLKVAYAGANVPYPLRGPGLNNEVAYVSTSGEINPLDHEISARLELGKGSFLTPEPIVSRLVHCPQDWAMALQKEEFDYLVVMKLPRNVLVNSEHDSSGYPVEKAWADEAPAAFKKVYADDFSVVYKVEKAGAETLEPGCSERPADYFFALRSDPAAARALFPLAGRALESMKAE